MSDQVSFALDVAQCGDLTGISLHVDDGGDYTTCYQMLFRGPRLEDLAFKKLFESCHQAAMDKVGLAGEVEWQVYEAMLEDSLEIACCLMHDRHGFQLVQFEDIEPEMQLVLMSMFQDPYETSTLN